MSVIRRRLLKALIRLVIVMLAVGIAGATKGVSASIIFPTLAGTFIVYVVLTAVAFVGDCLLQFPYLE
jgi:hypothetical protein